MTAAVKVAGVILGLGAAVIDFGVLLIAGAHAAEVFLGINAVAWLILAFAALFAAQP